MNPLKGIEEKVVASTAGTAVSAGALAPLMIWLFTSVGVEIPDAAAEAVATVVIAAFAVIGAFVGGYFKKSATSSVSVGYVPGPSPDLEPPVPYNPRDENTL